MWCVAPTWLRHWSQEPEPECSGMIHPPLSVLSVTMILSDTGVIAVTSEDNLDSKDNQHIYDFLTYQHIPDIPNNNSYCCGFVVICQHFRINIITVLRICGIDMLNMFPI